MRPAPSEETPCNLCGAGDYEVVGRSDRDGHPLQTVICRTCGLVWTNPRPAPSDIDRYYEAEYRRDYKGTSAPPMRKIVRGMLGAQDRLRLLRPLVNPGDVLVDVGCGAGELVFLLRRRGIEASGLEPGREYSEFAREALALPVRTATVETASVVPASVDVATMFHALEHVANPLGVVRTVRGWLKPGGLLVVEVPNIDSIVQAPAHRFHYAHLHHFSGATLAALGEAAGLRHVSTQFSDDGGNVTGVFRREQDDRRAPSGLESSAAVTRAILRRHTTARHYLSGTPYIRVCRKLARRFREDRLLHRLKTVDDVLRWASAMA
jgi:2-polyprenyl-3-methyl-5-hydroxy-6-metoxy-1,4-benzoquinol methylase